MQYLELLAPARNPEIGIAAIDCGADAVYIAGPDFGARKAAGNSFEGIRTLCEYAHRFGARVFVTYNTTLHEDEIEEAHAQMLQAQDAGADAFIIRDEAICRWDDIRVPLHASTQCAIRDESKAVRYEKAGCSRIVLERELSLGQIRSIAEAVDCEIEFFVHGALCVCYSGDCRLSEHIDGRSADRGECIQACRSLYDLVDGNGKVLLKNKALLSLKDFNLKNRLEELAEAGVCSFKIEGRLKNASYVRNVTRDYDLALNELVEKYPDRYRRASFGRVSGGFTPDTDKTFNRGYTELYLDGKRDRPWSSMDAPKSMGKAIGRVSGIHRTDGRTMEIEIAPAEDGIRLHNGDGFAFVSSAGITGFRGDVCRGMRIRCKSVTGLKEGTMLYRNIDAAFEKELEACSCRREIRVGLSLLVHGRYTMDIKAVSEDGREADISFEAGVETARNRERAAGMLKEQLSKRSGTFSFRLDGMELRTEDGELPLLSPSAINGMRRRIAEELEAVPCKALPLYSADRRAAGGLSCAEPLTTGGKAGRQEGPARYASEELMRTRYCIRYELGMCPRYQGGRPPERLFITNNGRRFALGFDCKACEMTVTAVRK